MTLNVNQFAQSDVQGRLDMRSPSQAVSVRIGAASAGGLVPGQAVKLVDNAAKLPEVVECAANSDDVIGFIILSQIKNVYNAGDLCEIAIEGFMLMTASAAIAKGAMVSPVIAGQLVATATTGARIIGRCWDKALANGDLVRVQVKIGALSS